MLGSGISVRRIKHIVKWYLKSGLFHPIVVVLLAIIALSFYSILETYEGDMENIMISTVFEYTLLPLYALAMGLHLVRSPLEVIFEVNMFKDWKSLFAAKLVSFVLACAPLALTVCLIAYAMNKHYIVIPLMIRLVAYTALLAPAILLRSQKAALFYFVTMYMLIPLSSPIILNGALQAQGRIDVVLSLFFYFTSPMTMIQYAKYTAVAPLEGYTAAAFISILIVLLSMKLFERLEYGPEY